MPIFVSKKPMQAAALLIDLADRTRDNLHRAEQLQQHTDTALNFKPDKDSWSALECLEHLNRYGNFYLPEITRRLATARPAQSGVFKSGWLGNYFANMMLPKEKLRKMNTFPSMNPSGSTLDTGVLETFIHQQRQLLDLLDQARGVDLQKTKTVISISKWIRLRLGDTFRVVIYHNQRHLLQAERAVAGSIQD